MVAALSPTSFPMSRSWLSLIRSLESGSEPAPWSSAARARTRSRACLSSSVCRAGSEDFSSAMQNYICLNPSEYHIELASERVPDRVGQCKRRDEGRLRVDAGRPIHRVQVIAHVPVDDLWRSALEEKCSATNGCSALVAFPDSGAGLLRRDVVLHRRGGDTGHGFVRDHIDRLDRIVRAVGEGDGKNVRLLSIRQRSPFAVQRQRQQDISLRLLRVVQESLDPRPILALPERIHQIEDVSALALLLGPI